MRLESRYSREQCAEKLRAALSAQKGTEEPVKGVAIGGWFRLRVRGKWSFWRKSQCGYVLYGRLREDVNGRTEISCCRLMALLDPPMLVYIYLVLCLVWTANGEGLPSAGWVALMYCVFVPLLGLNCALLLWWRGEDCKRLREKLDGFLRETFDVEP